MSGAALAPAADAPDGRGGWLALAGGFVATMLVVGALNYSFGLFVEPLSREFGLNRAEANRGLVLILLGMMVWSPLAGQLHRLWPARRVMLLGAGLFAAGAVMAASARSPAMLGAALAGPLAAGAISAGALTVNTLVTRWFVARRGRALGIASVATSAGGLVVVPIMAWLILQFGWRQAVLYAGLAFAGIIVALALTLVREPASAPAPAHTAPPPERRALALIGDARFWQCALAIAPLMAADQALLASLVPHLRQQQVDVQTAAWLMSAMTASAIAGKLLVGWAADRVRLLPLFAIVIACHLVLLAVLSLTAAVPLLFITVLTVGLALGGVFPLWSLLIASRFEPREFPLAYGMTSVITTAATMAMVEVAGRLFDGAGTYRPVWLLLAALATLSLTIAFIVLRRDAAPMRAVTTSG